jgi:hypothetical protein
LNGLLICFDERVIDEKIANGRKRKNQLQIFPSEIVKRRCRSSVFSIFYC